MTGNLAEQTPIDLYRAHCAEDPSVPIFCQDWWLDAVAPDAWNVALVKQSGRVQAALPYVIQRRFGMRFIDQPALTQFTGPWLAERSGREQNRLTAEKDIFYSLIDQLPDYDSFRQNWHHSLANWLPFHWRGFSQTTRYTYRLTDLADLDAVWKGFSSNIRSDVRKAEKRFEVRLRKEPTLDALLALARKTFERQGKLMPYTANLVGRINTACAARGQRRIFIAEDSQGRAHAGCYLVWDDQCAYYLIGGGDPELRNSGATSFVVWEAIRFAAGISSSFDFEGSMLEPVERFFRSFGATQTQYFNVSRINSRCLIAVHALRSMRRLGR
ncbi:GNAT family N-acetyltransferase [Notoacmeibacter sp. MSK16QG-6]|uniref:GNAT family N-acetyltransferase n=1 Tax=Notoacmeibacter sp. MSK16QG-6 TaxID=2957982 RepID=UPI00209E7E46|nr:GNAT family N-acetyltransferase [Notoacmeibacter sp. MSK16QG-6]MCP1198062.1 GNAT family N-acetyltransferase [Notoacmeibacter sp. MSK16QG-6]